MSARTINITFQKEDSMKKPIKISLIVLCCLLVVAVILYFAEKQNGLLSRIYFGDRITVTIEGTVDGESAQPDSTQVECVDDNGRQEVHHSGSDKYSVRANEYGMYTFTFPINRQVVQLKLVHTNWWNIDHYQFRYKVDTTTGSMTYTLTYNNKDTESDTVKLTGNSYSIYYMN